MYIPRGKLLRKFWVILLFLMVLVHTLIPTASAASNINKIISRVNRNTMKTAPIRAKEIEGPIPNPQYEYYLNHKEEFTYGYIPPKYIFPQEKARNIRTRSGSSISGIKKYDSRSSNINENHFGRSVVTPRKDQFYTGTCWAHANLSVVETLLKIKYNQDYNLSEGHMAYNIDNMTDLQSGGLDEDALVYYARLSGPVLESNFSAYTIDENNPKDRKQKLFDSSRANLLPENERDTFKIMGDAFNKKLDVFVPKTLELGLTLENLKKCIYENGSVQGTYLIAEDGYSKDVLGHTIFDKWSVKKNGVRYHYVRNFKNSNYLKYNHAVALIGWDDDKEITNSLGERATGAFLVKNSIPAPPYDRYDDARGYHWISYESFLGNGEIVPSFTKIITPRDARLMDAVERASLKNLYNPCKLSNITFNQKFNIKGNLNKAINVYERGKTEPETIKYVTYYNKSEGSAPYTIYITEDPEILKKEEITFTDGTKGEILKDIYSDKWVALASGTFTEKGYQTLEVTMPYTLTSDKFALKIETKSKTLGLAYRSYPQVEKVPASSYMYNDENPEHFFQKIDDYYKIFLGTITVKPNEYTVTVINDGNGTAEVNITKGPKGTKVSLTANAKPGYEFDKWEIEGATAQDPQASETTITIGEGNVTAKAIFKKIPPKEYKVSFETTYGTKPADQKIKENEKAKAPTGFEKDTTEILDSASGKTYIFKGWFLGTEEYNFETEVKEDKKLTAKWEEKIIPTVEYTVTVTDDGNGTATADPSKGPKGTKVNLKAVPNPDYEFDKWEVEGATALDPQASETTLTIREENVTAKAIFKKIPPKEYTVTVTDDGNGTATADPSKGPKGTKVNLKAVPNPDYEFDKWEVEGAIVSDINALKTTLIIGEGNATAKAVFKKAKKVFNPAHVETMVVKTQPTNLSYTEGEKLNLAGLEVTLTDNQGLTKDVAFADFVDNGITAEPANDIALTVANHNGKKVTLTKGNLTADTNALTVNKKDDLTKYKEKAKEEIDKLSNLTNQEKKEFKDKVDEQVDKPGVDKVVEEAKAKNDAKVLPPTPTPTPTPNRPYWPEHREEERPYRPYRPNRNETKQNDTEKETKPVEEKIEEAKVYDKLEAILFINNNLMQKSVNGVVSQVRMDIAPFIYQSRTMLPIRFVAESLGFMVTWDANTRTVYLVDKENIVQIPVDTNNIIVNGNTFVSDVKPIIKNNRTMLPVANVARALGLEDGKDILWDAVRAMVTLKRNVLK